MDAPTQVEFIVELVQQLGVDVRREHLGGAGGGLCKLRGKQVLFIDLDADAATAADRCIAALAALPGLEERHVPPAIRERIDALRETPEQKAT